MPSLTITDADLTTLIDHSRREHPREACGLIGGARGIARQIVQIRNVSARPEVQFEMDRQAMVETILRFEKAGQEVVGIYHSHPTTEAVPSPVDIAQATWPDAVYLIIGLKDADQPVVRAWTIRYGKADPVNLIVK